MKLSRCPVCHSNLHLDALVNDAAASELLALIAPLDGGLGRALVAYIGLFRPAKSDLSFSRALKLAEETLSLCSNRDWLRVALGQTVASIRAGRASGQPRALTNHNYLKKVLSSIDDQAVIVPSKPAKAMSSIEIKSSGHVETLAETQAKWEAQMAKYKQAAAVKCHNGRKR
ncbi:hypothetical protein LZP69_10520 [Shewanella sp. AS1]|uniref:hypothetical protein n=1 Tax=Shewanella sp. AS1 TaxID=2907626 RepID=UPI001F3B8B60|nr:hypothetical protein [Shewanella sp. AS1]MCE9679593.1 hypothetical protein [Shewanella sp. AS1]